MVTGLKPKLISVVALSIVALWATAQNPPVPTSSSGTSPDELRQKLEERRRGQSGSQVRGNVQPNTQSGNVAPAQALGQGQLQQSSGRYTRRSVTESVTPSSGGEGGSGATPQSGISDRLRITRQLEGSNWAGRTGGRSEGTKDRIQQGRPGEPVTPTTLQSLQHSQQEQASEGAVSRGIEKKDIRRGRVQQTPPSSLQQGETQQGSLADRQREQLRQRYEELKRKSERGVGESGTQAGQQDQSQTGNLQTPPSGTKQSRLSREELKRRLEERKQGQQTGETQAGLGTSSQEQGTPTPQIGTRSGRLTRDELKQKLEEKRRGQKGQEVTQEGQSETQGTPATGTTGGQHGQRLTREEMRQRLEELRQKRAQGQQQQGTPATGTAQESPQTNREQLLHQLREGKRDQAQQLSQEEREKIRNLYQQAKGQNLRDLAQQLRSQEGAGSKDSEAFKARLAELRKLQAEERAKLVGANLQERKAALESRLSRQRFTAEELRQRFGDVQTKPRIELAKNDLERLNRGDVPPLLRPRYDEGIVHRPLEREWRYRHERWFCPPPPPRGGFGVDLAGFHWEYWDGRHRYDHHWAINIFINIGHVRYGGFDGVIVGGRYFCYGWGWIDGCIDYGDCRVWVPGFWAPYTVTECCECEVWVPPVYDWVWTGCCWEKVMVSGGYFVRQPSGCHTVTRWRWVPGHFQYYRC
ncbi:MAG: hypothetical protein N2Z21_10050 [Candidatus Sumerlaeaceae bacterium]|nr:hypothetical protein [Candidatus Sumerlaeaceae bacterium]